MTLADCLRSVIAAAEARPGGLLDYAAAYAREGQRMIAVAPPETDGPSTRAYWHEVVTQIMYVRANLSGWRGSEAREVRSSLDDIASSLKNIWRFG